jgi:peroxiredoxin
VLIAKPVNDGITRSKQERNSLMHGVPAPVFNTSDIFGKTHRLADYEGKVVLVNIWATWCAPCRAEMPKLDQLYREKESQGFIVFGISDEEIATQRNYLQQVSVSYPLLTLSGTVPNLYKDVARYPANFLIDRQGNLQLAPDPGKPFEQLATAVDALLGEKRN